jgi:hypothetical protein
MPRLPLRVDAWRLPSLVDLNHQVGCDKFTMFVASPLKHLLQATAMSYDLYFWQQNISCQLAPEHVVEHLCKGEYVQGVERLPVYAISSRIKLEFPGIVENSLDSPACPKQLLWDNAEKGCFIAYPCMQYLCIESHQATGEVLNRLIDIALEFNCLLYDPQTNQRYNDR